MTNPFIPDKKKTFGGLLYSTLVLSYGLLLVVGVDLFLGTNLLASAEMNRDPLSGAAWMLGVIVFTPLMGLMTNVWITGDES